MIHDIEPKHLYNEWKPNAVPKRSSAVVQFCGRNLLCRIDDNGLKLPSRAMFPDGDERFTYLFELDGREYYLLFDENERALDGYSYRNIGLFRTEKPKELAYAAVSAWHLCSWYRDARYCGRCGEKLVHDVNERMMRCPKCGNIMMGYWCRLDGDDDTIHLDNFELADGAWVSRKELQETFVNNGIALTAEMISEFAAGRDPYSLEKNK